MEKDMKLPQQTKNKTTVWPNNSTHWHIYDENENTNLKSYVHLNVHSSIMCNIQDMEAMQVRINR